MALIFRFLNFNNAPLGQDLPFCRWEGFRDLVEKRRVQLEEVRLVKFILDEKLAEIECQLNGFKIVSLCLLLLLRTFVGEVAPFFRLRSPVADLSELKT